MEDLKGKEKPKNSEGQESEEKNKLERLIKHGEWKRLDESLEYRDLSREAKMLILFETINNRIRQLGNVFMSALKRQPKKAAKIQEEIRYLSDASEALSGVLADNVESEKVKVKKAA